ncbi:MAG: pyridoxamine kinase, partial [Clostridiales bacterium]|nr:pyridoxamine kinase [Clostridiales bacterium]
YVIILKSFIWGVYVVRKIAVFNDLSGLGKCSLTAAIPIISALGIHACPIPTAVLSNQTGYESYFIKDCTDCIDNFTREWQKLNISFDGILTGFLVNSGQVEKILRFLKAFRNENTILVVDPVMADNGETYDIFTDELRDRICELIPMADVITPNLTECCILSGSDYGSLNRTADDGDMFAAVFEICRNLIEKGVKNVIVTGVRRGESICNCICSKKKRALSKTRMFEGSFSGTGDIFACVVCGYLVKGLDIQSAVDKAADFISASIEDTIKDKISPNDGINFEKHLRMLVND